MTAKEKEIVAYLRDRFPQAQALYLFGSRASGQATPESDYDLALLLPHRAEPTALWGSSQALSRQLNCDVDLLDLQDTPTVMQYQIITKGKRLWQKDDSIDNYEVYILREKLDLDERREPQIKEILKTGSIYGQRYTDQ